MEADPQSNDEEPPYLKTLAELGLFMDRLAPSEEQLVRWRLGPAKQAAEAANDEALVQAIDAEGNAYLFFGEAGNLAAALADVRTYFNDAMIEYLQQRREATPALTLRARYGHVIAAYTLRSDEGLRAVDAYVEAVDHYLDVERDEPLDALHALNRLIPLMLAIGRKYRARDRILPSLIASVQTTNPYLRKTILELIVGDSATAREVLESLRDDTLRTISELRGAMELSDIQSVAELGIRLDARLGRTDRAHWLLPLAEVYREIIAESAAHPIKKEQAAQRAAIIFQELGDAAARAEMIRLQREYAGEGVEYYAYSKTLDESGEMADVFRTAVERAFEEGGALRVLGYLGLTSTIMPTMENARASLLRLEEQGVGVFSQIATTVVRSADNRVVGHGEPGDENRARSEWEQFGFGCVYMTYGMAVAAQAMIANASVTIDGFESFFHQTWIGADEDGQPNDLVALLVAPLRMYVGLLTHTQHDDAIVLTIDSLTLRFEAVFRKLARRFGEPDWTQRTDRNGRPYTQVAGLELLENTRIIAFLGEDLHALATYTLAGNDEGLRDKIAHAATHLPDYTMANAHALVFLLLRLAMHPDEQPAEN